MTKIEEFINKVLTTDKSFNLSEDSLIYHFIQDNIGEARYIYGDCDGDGFYTKLNNKYQVVAIVKGEIVYIVDRFMFGLYGYANPDSIELPENTILLKDCVDMFNQGFLHSDFPKWYAGLEPQEVSNLDVYIEDARRDLLYNGGVQAPSPDPIFDMDNVASMLAGFRTVAEIEGQYFDDRKQQYIDYKTKNTAISQLIVQGKAAEPWEIAMAEALRGIDAKNVTVEFEFKGRTGSGKLKRSSLMKEMIDKWYIHSYDFASTKTGKQLIKGLGAEDVRWREYENVLTCKDIVKITYGRKVLYKRSEVK